MSVLNLSADEVLSTTRAVRKRLDFDRPVPRKLLTECMELALQAPTGSNAQGWQFVFVTDQEKRNTIAEFYRKSFADYTSSPQSVSAMHQDDAAMAAIQARVLSSAQYLADNLHRVPVFLIPCITGRTDGPEIVGQTFAHSSILGSIMPAVWSFMLAARNRSLGTCLTTLHLPAERQTADLLGIPYATVMQVGLVPVAYSKGVDFKVAPRKPMESIVHFDQW